MWWSILAVTDLRAESAWKWGQDGVFTCMFRCVFTCAPTSFWFYEQMFLCWRLMCKRKIKKACYFSTHLWACEKWEAHLILLVKVFLIRARFFPFCSCWGEASIFGIETSTSLTRTCNQKHSTKPLFISLSYFSYFWSVYLLAHR